MNAWGTKIILDMWDVLLSEVANHFSVHWVLCTSTLPLVHMKTERPNTESHQEGNQECYGERCLAPIPGPKGREQGRQGPTRHPIVSAFWANPPSPQSAFRLDDDKTAGQLHLDNHILVDKTPSQCSQRQSSISYIISVINAPIFTTSG